MSVLQGGLERTSRSFFAREEVLVLVFVVVNVSVLVSADRDGDRDGDRTVFVRLALADRASKIRFASFHSW